MSSINNVVLVGNLTRDVEVKYVGANQTAIGSTGIALNRKYGENEEVTFVDLTFFGKLAEVAGEHLTKGAQVGIQGRLKLDQWETDGQKRQKLGVIVEQMQMLGKKVGGGETKTSNSQSSSQPTGQPDEIPF